MMGTCVTLIVLAWFVVRLYSTPAAIVMSLIAMVIPPFAAIVGNRDTDHSDNTDQHS
jgi:ABC-type transport system involved in cytochrome bd biosynthesis fused ATPase/permease subunit